MITDKLIMFRDMQDPTILGISDPKVNQEDLNVITIEILSWLKLERKRELWIMEGKKTRLKPLKLNSQYSWSKALENVMKADNAISEVFTLKEGDFTFRNDINEEYRSKVRNRAYEVYNPKQII